MATITKQALEEAVRSSTTISDVARKLGKQPKGGNISALVSKCKLLGVDTQHLRGQSWAKGKSKLTADQLNTNVFVYGGKGPHKQILIRERGHKCECCDNEEWLGKQITLELDHIDGDRDNNVRDNLQLLCPNCHSYTPTWRGRNVKKGCRVSNADLKKALKETDNIKQALTVAGLAPKGANYKRAEQLLDCMYAAKQQIVEQPVAAVNEIDLSPFTREELSGLLWTYPTTTIAKMYNMTDNGVAYWARKWKLTKPSRGYWQKQTACGEIGRTQQA